MKQLIKTLLYRLRGDYTTEKLISMGMSVGKNFKRLNGVILDPSHCWLITIGDNVTLAPRVHILAHDASTCFSLGYAKIGKVMIGDNVFIGAESVILPNTTIGNNVIIGANSTVVKDIPANEVWAGTPAHYICTYEEYIEKNKRTMLIRPCYEEDYTTRKNIDTKKKEQMKKELEDGIGFVK